jgi:hypothetical protein
MNTNYLRAFVIASSILVVLPHFLAVAQIDKIKMNYTYEQYSIIAPIYYGLMNMLSLYLALSFDLSIRQRFILIGTLSPLLVISFSFFSGAYAYNTNEWFKYGIKLFIKHFLIWNVVIFLLDKFV